MLLNRCKKLYNAIEHLTTVFKLLTKRMQANCTGDSKINERLRCAVKGFLVEHTLFPVHFHFKGEDLLASLRRLKNL